MEQDSVNQRLNFIVDTFEKGKKAAFARKAGISPQGAQEILAGRKGDPSFKVLVKILESYPTIDANWLVLGRGSMTRGEEHSSIEEKSTQPISVEQIEAVVKEVITTELGLNQAAQREAEEASQRAVNIISLELETFALRIKIEDLTQLRIATESKEVLTEDDQKALGAMKQTYRELSEQLNSKYHLIMALKQEDKRALQNIQAVSEQLAKVAAEELFKPDRTV